MSLLSKVALGTAVLGAAAVATTKWLAQRGSDAGGFVELPPVQIEMADDFDVTFWMRRLGVSKHQLKKAVKQVGSRAEAVEQLLGARA